jgi:hypothetical protein
MRRIADVTAPRRRAQGVHVPIHYERDDERRRLNIMTVGQVAPEDILGVLERQAKEGAWSYGVLYDARAGRNARRPTRCGR